jgi:hypothetical protein
LSVRARASTPPAPTGAGAERAAGDGADEATTDCSAGPDTD